MTTNEPTNYSYSSSSSSTSDSEDAPRVVSLPISSVQRSDATVPVKKQLSAPSYFYSLTKEDLPPFRKPTKEPVPKILVGTIMTDAEAIEMIAMCNEEMDGLHKFLHKFLVEKGVIENTCLQEEKFLVTLVNELIDYAAQRDFDAEKLACFVTIYLKSHMYFRWYYWLKPDMLWNYFFEIMLRHTIEDSPEGQEVFEAAESYDIVTHFHTNYIKNLPLIHILTFGCYKIKFSWPFNK